MRSANIADLRVGQPLASNSLFRYAHPPDGLAVAKVASAASDVVLSMLSKTELSRGLKTDLVGKKLFVFESIDSTNTCARTLAEAGTEEGSVVVADYQSEGRGRLGRTWQAEPAKNLLFSVLLRPKLSKEQSGLLTFYAAIAVSRAIESMTGQRVECKWPNDILLNGKKVCGILIENSFEQEHVAYSVLGIGLNVNQHTFAQELTERATSIANELHAEIDRAELFRRILQEIDALYQDVQKSRYDLILQEWKERCRMFGQQIDVSQGSQTISGVARGLSTTGGLIMETAKGLQTIHAGDITIHRR